MNKWRTVMAYKKYAIVHDIELNKEYNIEELTNFKFKNVKVFYTITYVLCKNKIKYHVDIDYTLLYPNILFENKYKEYDIEAKLTCIFFENGDKLYE